MVTKLYTSSKKMNSILYTLMFAFAVMMVMGFASATTLPPVKQGDCIALPQSEYGSAYQNISGIQLPNKTVVNKNVVMTKANNLYNYTFCNTNLLGVYIVNGFSDLSTWAYDFEVNASGAGAMGNSSIALVIILIVFAGLFMLIGY